MDRGDQLFERLERLDREAAGNDLPPVAQTGQSTRQDPPNEPIQVAELEATRLRGIGDTYLDDKFEPRVTDWDNRSAAQGVPLPFTSAYRTPDRQLELQSDPFARTPAGLSLHSAGFAVDVQFDSLGDTPGGLTGDQKRQIIVDTARGAGISWGGEFRPPDRPHFYVDPGGDRNILIDNATRRYCYLSGNC